MLTGRLRSRAPETLALDAARARLLDDAGREVRGTVSFAAGFSHGLYGPGTGPREAMPEFQARRLGVRAAVAPGATVPFTVAWRLEPGQAAPTRVELCGATVALPPAP